MHPAVLGELALGNLADRDAILTSMGSLPRTVVARDSEVLELIGSAQLHGRGIGYVDACLLASTRLTGDAVLWTHDEPLARVADDLGVASA